MADFSAEGGPFNERPAALKYESWITTQVYACACMHARMRGYIWCINEAFPS